MKLTIATLLDYAELGDTALRVWITVHARIEETGCQDMTAAALLNLPGLPRNPKALARAIQELASSGLVFGDEETGRYVFPIPERGLSSKRAAAGRLGGLAKASKRLASASGLPPSNGLAMPDGCQTVASGALPEIPLASPSEIQTQNGTSIAVSGSLPALSSGSEGPESKRARGRKSRFVPVDWSPKEAHVAYAKEHGLDLSAQVQKYRNTEFHRPKSDWDRTFSVFLQNAVEWGQGKQTARATGGSLPGLLDRIQRMEANGEGN